MTTDKNPGGSIPADVASVAKREVLIWEYALPYVGCISWLWVVMWHSKIAAAGVTAGVLIGLVFYRRDWSEKLWDRTAVVAIERGYRPPVSVADYVGFGKRYQFESSISVVAAIGSILVSFFAVSGMWAGLAIAISVVVAAVSIAERRQDMAVMQDYVAAVHGHAAV